MSVDSYKTKDGTRFRVRWRDGHGEPKSRVFTSRREANAFDVDVKARKNRGEMLPTRLASHVRFLVGVDSTPAVRRHQRRRGVPPALAPCI
jgi:hypothetical protein